MRVATKFKTRKPVDKTNQYVIVERSDQRAASFLRRDEMRQRHDVKIRNAPNFLLQIFDGPHLRHVVDLPDCYRASLHQTHFLFSIGNAMYDALDPDR